MKDKQDAPGPKAKSFGKRIADEMFRGRKGHGGGPCSFR